MHKSLFLLLVSLSLLACSDISLGKIELREPKLVVYPELIEFGNLESGSESGVEEIIIMNAGDEDLIISSPVLYDGSTRFSIEQVEEFVLGPSEIYPLSVYYEPETFEHNGALVVIESNDDEYPEANVILDGYGDAPVISVSPDDIDYGQISIGCDNEERVTIRNEGNLDLVVDDVTQMATNPPDILMEFGSLPELPWTLLPTEELDFLVSYIPTDINFDESIITVSSNDPKLPEVEVIQYGDGDVEHWYTQSYLQEEIPILDIIFVIDNSGSMGIFQQELGNQMTSFMNVFITSGADYHLAFITTDSGQFKASGNVSWIDNSFQNPVDWAQGVISQIGIGGSGHEKGIQYAQAALTAPGPAAPGSLFLREEATLVIIYVSDEPDHSNGGWGSYTNFFDSLKPDVSLMRHFAVIGDYPSGCTYNGFNWPRNIHHGSGYYDMTQRYNGDWYSICASDWGQQMQSLADTVTTRRTFQLDEPDPIEATISVYVNGQSTSEWFYDPNNNTVSFNEGAVPEPNQTITIEYAVWGCGDE